MACASKTRVRPTYSSAPPINWTIHSTQWDAAGKVTLEKDYVQPAYIPETFEKSIVDVHCVYTPDVPDGDIDPCAHKCVKASCADCIKQSKINFNMVRSHKHTLKYAPWAGTVIATGSWGASVKWEGQNYHIFGPDGIHAAESYANLGPLPPSAMELSDALRKITPGVEKFFPTMQIYETLFELKELKKLLRLFTVRRKQSVSQGFTASYLGLNFGYLPLVTTVRDIVEILLTLDNVIDQWNDFATSDRIMDFHGTIRESAEDGVFSLNTTPEAYVDESHIEYKYSTSDVLKIHLYIQPKIIPGNMRFRVLAKALGLDKPLGGIWELMPFSWLVDYFVNVDEMVERWETGLNSMFQFEVANLGYSMRRETIALSRESRTFSGGNTYVSGWTQASDVLYERVPLPVSSLDDAIIPRDWGWADGPSGTQWTYVLAVANTILPGKTMAGI